MRIQKGLKELAIRLGPSIAGGLVVHFLLSNLIYTLLTLCAILGLTWVVSKFVEQVSAARKVGIIRAYPNRKESEKALRAYLRGARDVRILAIRGLHIIGSDHSILYTELLGLPRNDWPQRIRVLLLDPNSTFIERRAEEVSLSSDDYRSQCVQTRNFIDYIKTIHYIINISRFRKL